jgi:hypothetical protein
MPLLTRTAPEPTGSAVRRTLGRTAARVVTVDRLELGRAGAGAVMVLRPKALPGMLGVDSATSSRMGWAVQLLGARELALGLGSWVALRRPDVRAARVWLTAGLLSDAVDAVVLARAAGRGQVGGPIAAAAVAAAAVSTALHAATLADLAPVRR